MNRKRKNKILITGGAGFLGRNLYSHLVSKHFEVTSMVHEHRILGQKAIVGDILDRKSLMNAMTGMDCVIHCAAKMGHGQKHEMVRVNSEGTKNILEVAVKSGVKKVIHISTLAVADEYIDHYNSGEDIPYPAKFRNTYTSSKIDAEKYALAKKDDLDVIILRPGWIWGPGDKSTEKLFGMIKGHKFAFIGNGENFTYFTHITNITQAIYLVVQSNGITSGEIFNITDGAKLTMKDFVNAVASEFGAPPVTRRLPVWLANTTAFFMERLNPAAEITKQNVAIMSKNLKFDIGKAKDLLGYRPARKLRSQIREVIKTDFN
ncbi:NAD-dependent epimerase/dehydratase family protein [[Eubacterium] cellulosolvens]